MRPDGTEHADQRLLLALTEQDLEVEFKPERIQWARKHLLECSTCLEALERLKELDAALHFASDAPPAPGFLDQVLKTAVGKTLAEIEAQTNSSTSARAAERHKHTSETDPR